MLTALVALFLTFDTVLKVLMLAPAVQGTRDTPVTRRAPAFSRFGVIVSSVCLALYLVPRTSVLGALLRRSGLWWRQRDPRAASQSATEPHALPDRRGLPGAARVYPSRAAIARELVPFRR